MKCSPMLVMELLLSSLIDPKYEQQSLSYLCGPTYFTSISHIYNLIIHSVQYAQEETLSWLEHPTFFICQVLVQVLRIQILINNFMAKLIQIMLISMFTIMSNSLYCQPYNCYQLLEVSKSATEEQIKKAFRLMARRHHPDKNKQQDTTQLFQKINIAYQILENQHTRKAYDFFLEDPSGSRAYHAYQFYRASYSPQVNPFFVIFMLLVLLSWLQWVMRNQMYASAIQNIVNSENFRKKVNQQCIQDGKKGDKRYKEEVAERLEQEISIQGGYSKPVIKDMLICKFFLLPFTILIAIKNAARWIWKYYIKREEYDAKDQSQITRKVLKVPKAQWENMGEEGRKQYIVRKLWIRANMEKFRQEMQQKQLEQLKESNPAKYRKIMSYLKKQQ